MKHNPFSRLTALLLLPALLLSLVSPAFAAGDTAPALTGLKVELEDTVITLGQSTVLTATVTPQPEGAVLPDDIQWKWNITDSSGGYAVPFTYSYDGGKLSITTDSTLGVGTAFVEVWASCTPEGGAVITAPDTCTVTVRYADATRVTLLSDISILDVNRTGRITANLTPTSSTDPNNVSWSVDNSSVLSLSSTTGQQVTVQGKKPGRAVVKAWSGSESVSSTYAVIVRGLAISQDSLSLVMGKSTRLTTVGYEVDGVATEWTSSNENVAIVSSDGQVTALTEGSAIITATCGSYSATCYVTVTESAAAAISIDIDASQSVSLESLLADLNEVCWDMLESRLDYITNLSVSTDHGVLYYGYSSASSTGLGVGGTELYYYSANTSLGERAISNLTFVPQAGYNGIATIYYTAYSATGASFTGQLRFIVEAAADIAYVTGSNTPIPLDASDFNRLCRSITGRALSSVTFSLPASSRGVLYYRYDENAIYSVPASAGTAYKMTGSPSLSDITFVPTQDYTGTVAISYTGTDVAGETFSGQFAITVTGAGASWDEITCHVNEDGVAYFSATDFKRACTAAGGTNLSYVRFTLPDRETGTLYYKYASAFDPGTAVDASTRYYSTSDPCISDIAFAANGELTEAAYITFEGYDTSGTRFIGRLCIEPYSQSSVKDSSLYYTTKTGLAADFDADDFNELSLRCTGSRLSHVYFTLPPESSGSLHYNYASSYGGNPVSATTRYYRSGTLSRVSFIPASGFTGTVGINFEAHTVDETTFKGVVWITVEAPVVKEVNLSYSTASSGAVTMNAAELNAACLAVTGEMLDYVRFALPSSSQGVLCYGYNPFTGTYTGRISDSTNCYREDNAYAVSTRRTLDDISFLASKTYVGTAELSYTGWTVEGTKFTGVIEITVAEPAAGAITYTGSSLPIALQPSDFEDACQALFGRSLASVRFTTLPDQSMGRLLSGYVAPALPGSDVSANTTYYPDGYPSLGDIMFRARAGYQGDVTLHYTGQDVTGAAFTGTVVFTLSDSYSGCSFTDMDSSAWAVPSVEYLYQSGIVTGADGRYNPNVYVSRGDFTLMICRAFRFNTGSLVSFSDVPSGSYYAWAVATARDLGIVQGDGVLFFPQSVLTREDAMVMLQRALNVAKINVATGSPYLLNYYADGDTVSPYARQALATLVDAGIIAGNDLGQLMPQKPVTWAEMAVILHRILTL